MASYADREHLYVHYLRCPNAECRKKISPDILAKHGLLTKKLKSLHENAHFKPASLGVAAQDFDKDMRDRMVKFKLAMCTCGRIIERSNGCNHMICKCGRHFCYNCQTDLGGDRNYTCPKCQGPEAENQYQIAAPAPPPSRRLSCFQCGKQRSRRRVPFTQDTLRQHEWDAHGY